MAPTQRKTAGDKPARYGGDVRISHAPRLADGRARYGGDVRISDDEWVKDEKTGEMHLSEKGITRQKEDIATKSRPAWGRDFGVVSGERHHGV